MINWIEQTPKEGDTVKIVWSDWMERNDTIGVVDRYSQNRIIIDVGDRMVWLDSHSSLYVKQ